MKTRTTILAAWLLSCLLISGQTFQAFYNFSGSQNPYANGKLLLLDGIIYGTTMGGGSSGVGAIFRIATNGSGYSVIKSFSAPSGANSTNADGAQPRDGLIVWSNTLFATTYEGGFGSRGTVFSTGTNNSSYTVLNHFSGANGKNPIVGLTLWSNVLYGTTAAGGISNKGAIFRVNPDGTGFSLVKSFLLSEGVLLLGGVATDGNTLYGTTYQGGISNRGTIYSVGVNGDGFTVLKTFSASDGSQPCYSLILSGSTLYGVTDGSGINSNSVVFRANTDGSGFQVIKRFSEPDPINGTNWDGSYIRGGMVLWNGVFYGTTRWGGLYGNGVVFKLNPDGTGFAVLKHFSATTSYNGGNYLNVGGMYPAGDLMVADGVLYGATQYGGNYGYGTLYWLTVPPTPALQTTNVAGQFVVCWTDDGYNRTLQTAPDLVLGNWISVTNLNWTNSSTMPAQIGLKISDTSGNPATFFRLR